MAESAGTIYADIQIRLGKLESGLRAANSKLDAFSAKSKQRSTGFEKAWSAAFTAIGFLGAQAITKLLNGIKQGASVFAGFQQSIANTISVTKAFGEEQRLITEAAKEAGETTRFSARQAADALYFLASAGLDARQSIDALDGVLQLAGATQSDLASTASTVTAILSQFNLQAAEAGRVSNVFAAAIGNSQANMQKLTGAFRQVGPVAAGLGLSLEETTGALQLLFNAGFQGQQAGRALKSALADLASPTSNITKIFGKLNISLDKVNPTTNDFASIIEELAKSGATTADIIDSFGKIAGPQIAVLVQQGADAIRDYTDAVTGTNAAAEAYAIQNETLQGSIDILRSKAESLAIAFFGELDPGLRKIINSFINLIEKSTPAIAFFGKILNAVIELVSGPLDLLASGIDFLSEIFKESQTQMERTASVISDVTDAIKKAEEIDRTVNSLNDLVDEYENLTSQSELTKKEQERLAKVIIDIEKIVPEATTGFDEYGNSIQISGEKAREAAKQMLIAKKAILEQSQANLENLKPALELTVRLRNQELDILKNQEEAGKAYETRLTGQYFALLQLRGEFEKLAVQEVARGEDSERSLSKSTEGLLRYLGTLRELGITQFDTLIKGGVRATEVLDTIDKLFPQIEKNFESFRKSAEKRADLAIEIEDAKQKLLEIEDLERQIAILQGEIEGLDKIDPVDPETEEKLTDLQRLIDEFWKNYQKDLDAATREARIFGDTQDFLTEKLKFLKNSYLDLIDKGLDPTSETLKKIKELYDETSQSLDDFLERQKKQLEFWDKIKDKMIDVAKALKSRLGKKFSDDIELTFETVLESATSLVSGLIDLFNELTQARLLDLDEQLQAELEAAGVAEETNLERIERELEAARKAGDQEKIDELEKEKKKEQIILDFEKKKAEAEYQGALFSWSLALLNATAKLYEAIMVATAAAPWPANLPAIIYATAAGVNVVGVAAQKPKPPSFQFGGIVPGSNYSGDNVAINANSGEMFLTRQNQADLLSFIRNISAGGMQAEGQTIVFQSVIDGDIVAQATINRMNDGQFTINPDRALT